MEKPWLRHYEEGVPPTLSYPPVPLNGLLEVTARAHAARPAVKLALRAGARVFQSGLTYAALQDQVDRFAAALAALGVQPGDRVGLMLPNLPQFVIAFYGTLKTGAVVVTSAPRLRRASWSGSSPTPALRRSCCSARTLSGWRASEGAPPSNASS